VVAADVTPWLERRLSQTHEGAVHVIYHTITWQYFDEDTKTKCKALIEDAGAHATKTAPLAWLSFEKTVTPMAAPSPCANGQGMAKHKS